LADEIVLTLNDRFSRFFFLADEILSVKARFILSQIKFFFFNHIRPGIEIYLKETPLIQDNKNTEGDGGFYS
jgi:hypothetical protein